MSPCPKCGAATYPECVKRCKAVLSGSITAADKVVALLSLLNADECSVILRVTERMVSGRQQYGGLNLAVDRRDWTAEAEAESLDLLAYLAMRTLTRGRGT